jgi:hypothetical protein
MGRQFDVWRATTFGIDAPIWAANVAVGLVPAILQGRPFSYLSDTVRYGLPSLAGEAVSKVGQALITDGTAGLPRGFGVGGAMGLTATNRLRWFGWGAADRAGYRVEQTVRDRWGRRADDGGPRGGSLSEEHADAATPGAQATPGAVSRNVYQELYASRSASMQEMDKDLGMDAFWRSKDVSISAAPA